MILQRDEFQACNSYHNGKYWNIFAFHFALLIFLHVSVQLCKIERTCTDAHPTSPYITVIVHIRVNIVYNVTVFNLAFYLFLTHLICLCLRYVCTFGVKLLL